LRQKEPKSCGGDDDGLTEALLDDDDNNAEAPRVFVVETLTTLLLVLGDNLDSD
jgi:hypothetical protein